MDKFEDSPVPSPSEEQGAELAIVGVETADHTVPAEVLLRALNHLQRIVYLLAAAGERRPIGERLGLSQAFRNQHALRCGVPRASSFALPLTFEASDPLARETSNISPLDRALDVFRSAADSAWMDLGRVVSDPKYLPRVLAELQAMLPRPGERWGVVLKVGSKRVSLDAKTYRNVRYYLAPDLAEDAMLTVTGDLIRIDIAQRRIVLRYRPTGREIPCHCEPSALESVLENWNEPIQVTGRFTLDREGNPIRLTGVTRVEPVDLSPMTFDRLEWSGQLLEIHPPLTFQPTMDEESGQLYMLADPDLGIDVFARTREEVADELAEQVLFQWKTFACESPERLTPGALRLSEAMKARMREDNLAAQPEGR